MKTNTNKWIERPKYNVKRGADGTWHIRELGECLISKATVASIEGNLYGDNTNVDKYYDKALEVNNSIYSNLLGVKSHKDILLYHCELIKRALRGII